jgi:hypothetical protein
MAPSRPVTTLGVAGPVREEPAYNPVSGEYSNLFENLNIDTTKLAEGEHRLLVGTCNLDIPVGGTVNGQTARGDHSGTLVVRFIVDNTPQSATRAFDMAGVGPCLLGEQAPFASRAGLASGAAPAG